MVEILMPKLGLTMKTGTVMNWLKKEGEFIAEKEPALQIETEKLSYDIESPADGVLLKILATVGEKYPIRAVLGYIGEPGESVPDSPFDASANDASLINASPTDASAKGASAAVAGARAGAGADAGPSLARALTPPPSTSYSYSAASHDAGSPLADQGSNARVFISPAAKKLAADLGLDYKRLKGSGPNGRIVKSDVYEFSVFGDEKAEPSLQDSGADFSTVQKIISQQPDTGIVVPYKGIRRATGEIMQRAWSTIPMVTHHVSAGAGSLMDYYAMLNADISDKSDRVTIGELLLKLTAVALAMVPMLNSSLAEEGIILHKNVHLGMATAIGDGLVVPVIHNADRKGLLALSREVKDLATRARSGDLMPDEITGATFTVSNLGGFDSVDYFTPIINPPQAAILGVGRVADTVVPLNGEIVIRSTVGLSLTYDHRIIDGATAAVFIETLMMLMDNPARAVLRD